MDGFDEPGPWRTGAGPDGEVAVEDGALRLVAAGDAAIVASSRPIGADATVVRVAADVAFAGGSGDVGATCASGDGDDREVRAWVSTDGRWRLVRAASGAERELGAGPLPEGIDLAGGGIARLTLECAQAGPADGERIAFWVDGVLVADRMTGIASVPWSRVGIAIDALEPPLLAFADEVSTWTGSAYEPVPMDPAVAALLVHLPDPWRATCLTIEPTGAPRPTAVVGCSPAGGADRAEYRAYTDGADLDDAFESLIAIAGDLPPTADCEAGPGEGTWSAGAGTNGRIACWTDPDDPARRTIAWTDPATGILGIGVRSNGGWPELYDWWLGAGPDA